MEQHYCLNQLNCSLLFLRNESSRAAEMCSLSPLEIDPTVQVLLASWTSPWNAPSATISIFLVIPVDHTSELTNSMQWVRGIRRSGHGSTDGGGALVGGGSESPRRAGVRVVGAAAGR